MIEERLSLISQWFNSWDEYYRIRCLDLLLDRCSVNLLQYVKYEATKKLRHVPPTQAVDSRQDFTRSLPRHLCLKIFSYLDPRSLCRSAQVCWYWKYLSECDELWQIKCSKLGWDLSDLGVHGSSWKACYQYRLSNIRRFSAIDNSEPIRETPTDNTLDSINDKADVVSDMTDKASDKTNTPQENKPKCKSGSKPVITVRSRSRERSKAKKEPVVPPWRPSNGKPEDTYFEKFNKVLKQKREAQRKSRSAVPGSKNKFLSNSLSSSQLNIKDSWIHENHEHDHENGNGPERTTNSFGQDRKSVLEETIRTNIRNEIQYETTDTLSQLQENHEHIPWNYTEPLSDEEYDEP